MAGNITYILLVMNLADDSTENIPCDTFKALKHAFRKYQNNRNYYVLQAYMQSQEAIDLDCIRSDMLNEWTPCYKKLPKKQDMYLVTLADGTVTTNFFSTTATENRFEEISPNNPVVAWMPRPEAWSAADH